MPEFVSLRSFLLSSTSGHNVRFEAQVPKFIPDALVPEAMAAGCVPTAEANIPFHDDASRPPVEFQGDMRRSLILLAIQHVVVRNNSKEFNGGGVPKAAVIADAVGFEVIQKEVTDLFHEYSSAKDSGQDLAISPQASNVMKVIEAKDRSELLDLAGEFGIEPDSLKGTTLRVLRQTLLTKLTGVALG